MISNLAFHKENHALLFKYNIPLQLFECLNNQKYMEASYYKYVITGIHNILSYNK